MIEKSTFNFGKTLAEIGETNFPPIRWAVDKLLPSGLVYLGGRPKAGKSFLNLQLLNSVAVSGEFCGRSCVTGDVLGLFLEDNYRRIQSRWRDGLGFSEFPKRARIVDMSDQFPKLGAGAEEALDTWQQSVADPRLIIIDTGQRLAPDKVSKKSQYAEDHALLERLQRMAMARNLCVIVVGHTKKSEEADVFNEIMGTGIPSVADSLLVFKRKPRSQEADLFVKGRDIEDAELQLYRDGAEWKEVESAELHNLSLGKRRLAEYFVSFPGDHSPAEIADAINMSYETAKKYTRSLEIDGLIRRVSHGRYERII